MNSRKNSGRPITAWMKKLADLVGEGVKLDEAVKQVQAHYTCPDIALYAEGIRRVLNNGGIVD